MGSVDAVCHNSNRYGWASVTTQLGTSETTVSLAGAAAAERNLDFVAVRGKDGRQVGIMCDSLSFTDKGFPKKGDALDVKTIRLVADHERVRQTITLGSPMDPAVSGTVIAADKRSTSSPAKNFGNGKAVVSGTAGVLVGAATAAAITRRLLFNPKVGPSLMVTGAAAGALAAGLGTAWVIRKLLN